MVSVRSVQTTNFTSTTASFNASLPALVVGDVLHATVNIDSKSVTVTTPTGWTLIDDISTSVSLGNRTSTYWRAVDGSEGATVSFALSAAKLGSVTILAIAGADSGSPIATHGTQNNATSSTSQSLPNLVVSVAGCLLIGSASAFINGSYTPPTGMTEQSDLPNSDTTTSVATDTLAAAGSTGSRAFTASLSSASITTLTAIKPAAVYTASVPTNADGDLLFAEVFVYNQGGVAFPDPIADSGWTKIDGQSVASTAYVRLATFYRIASSEPASYDFYGPNGTFGSVFISAFAGPWEPVPLDAHGTQQNASTVNATAPSLTVSQGGSLAIMSIGRTSSNTVSANPAGFSADQNGSIPTAFYRHDSLTNPAIAAGSTGALTATLSSTGNNVTFLAIFTPHVSITTSTRSVPATVAISVTGLARSVPASVAVKTTGSRSVPATAAIRTSGLTRSVPATARIATTANTRVIPATARIATTAQVRVIPATARIATINNVRVVPATVAIGTTANVRVVPATVNISAAATQPARVIPATVRVGTTNTRSVPAAVAIATTANARPVPSTVRISVAGITRVVPATVRLGTTNTRVIPATVAISATMPARVVPAAVAVNTTANVRAIPATARIAVTGNMRVVPATVAIKVSGTRVVPATAAVATTANARVVPATVSIAISSVRVIPATVSITMTATRVIPATVNIDLIYVDVPAFGEVELVAAMTGETEMIAPAVVSGDVELTPDCAFDLMLGPATITGIATLASDSSGAMTWES